MGFAEGLIKGDCTIERCPVSEDETRKEVAQLLGLEFKEKTKSVAVLYCNGGAKVKDRFVYQGIADCVAANLALGGQKFCSWGCLGLGSCERICPFGAITMSEEGLPVVDKGKCRACNKCVEVCPKKLFSLNEVKHRVHVLCKSHDLGKNVKAICSVGCIGCKLCEKACKFDAIHVIDNLAVIDYSKCTSCGACVKVCPMKTIHASARPARLSGSVAA